MNILLSNDDGYKSLGLIALQNALKKFGKVTTIAPNRDISASSSCLSVHDPIKVLMVSTHSYKVFGTPADCVHIGTRGILKKYPDIIFSGVNFGSNMGDDVIYSGTIGAAIEGRHAKFGSYAISITSKKPKYIEDINSKVELIIEYIFSNLKKYKTIFNINIPDLPLSKIKGIKHTKLGKREIPLKSKKIKKNNIDYYNIGKVGKGISVKDNDFHAVEKGYISITPIMIDMTDTKVYKKIKL